MISNASLIGRGPSFPLNMTERGGLAYSTSIARINHSLFILFETPKGSRLMLPEYGSDIHKYRFDPLDLVLMEKVRHTLMEDIRRWEPRISVSSIEFLTDPSVIDDNILYTSIHYTIISTKTPANYVYPYKLGTYDTIVD